jgi:proline iminopeptidase
MGLPPQEELLPIDQHDRKIAYWSWGEGDETLLGLHGGPGLDHRYLTRLSELGGGDLRVVLYDQLGGGKSDRPSDDSLWTTERFVSEVEAVRDRLGLGTIHLFGQSWGGWLALEYVLRHPQNVKSLVLSNTSSSIPETFKDMMRLRTELPADIFTTLVHYEADRNFDHSEYQSAVHNLYARHLRRATPFEIERSLAELEELVLPLLDDVGDAYRVMWGPHEFLCNGSLLTWDVTDRLAEIEQPTLILCGYYDELTVAMHRTMSERILDNEFVIFGNASHLTILEKEADAYLAVIGDFVRRHSGTTKEIGSRS